MTRRLHRSLLIGSCIVLGHSIGRGDPFWVLVGLAGCVALTWAEEW